jgi:hypothetical protein
MCGRKMLRLISLTMPGSKLQYSARAAHRRAKSYDRVADDGSGTGADQLK